MVNLTHWSRDKMALIFQTTFSNAFSWMNVSIKISLKIVFKGIINIGSDHGLAPARRQAIIWTNAG